METLGLILSATFIGSIGSLIGGVILLANHRHVKAISHILTSFAAGALLGTAFFDLLPEAAEHSEEFGLDMNIFMWMLGGILFFYLLERAIHWFFYHRTKQAESNHKRPIVALIMVGDSVHNFVDGVAIAITFLVNPAVGFLTTFAVAAHEIPQEIGDFAVMLHEGLSRKKVLLFNVGSAAIALIGAFLAFIIGQQLEMLFPYALSLTAGFFLYIALANLIPEIHHEEKKGYAFWETLSLLLGVFVIWFFTFLIPHGG